MANLKILFSVEDYGAVHDGVLDSNGLVSGTDDTAAIQAAINACFTAGGGIVYFPIGIYKIAGSLVTSLNSVNPNCQIYIPLTGPYTSQPAPYVKIKFLGEQSGSLVDGMIGAREPNSVGVILFSTITGSGILPSVIGHPWDTSVGFNYNQTEVEFENIEVRVKSKSGATDQAPTMTAFNFAYLSCAQVFKCIASIQSQTFTSASPASSGTVGFYFPQVNNAGMIYAQNCQARGFAIGYRISEHFVGDQIWATGCYKGLQIDYGYHVARVARFFSNGCAYGLYFNGSTPVQIEQFGFERSSHSAWYDSIYDVGGSAAAKGVVFYYGFVQGNASDETITLDGLDSTADFVKINRVHQKFGGGGYSKGNLKHGDFPNSPWLELNSGTDGVFSCVNLCGPQSDVNGGVSVIAFTNPLTGVSEMRTAYIRAINNGSLTSGALELYVLVGGTLTKSMTLKGAGKINLSGIPTSAAGLASGDVYSNGNVLTIVPSADNGLTTGILSYWKFDANANDSVGSNNGTVTGASLAAGKINNGYSFTGNQYITVNDANSLSFGDNSIDTPFSISLWIKPTGVAGNQYLITKRDASTNEEYQFFLVDNTVALALFSQGGSAAFLSRISGLTISAGVFSHLVFTYSGNSAIGGTKIYINGVLSTGDNTSNTTGSYVAMKNGTSNVAINSQSWNIGNGGMAGVIDEVGLWGIELTQAKVTALYNSGAGLQYPF